MYTGEAVNGVLKESWIGSTVIRRSHLGGPCRDPEVCIVEFGRFGCINDRLELNAVA